MPVADPFRRTQTNAEILIWQSWIRLGVAAAILLSSAVFRLLGFPDDGGLGQLWLGAPEHLVAAGALAALYAALVLGTAALLRRRRRAGTAMLVGITLADGVFLIAGAALISPPDAYARVLLLSFFTLQLALLYFGRALAAMAVASVVALYATVVAVAVAAGTGVEWRRELWTLFLYAVCAAGFLLLQGGFSARLARLVHVFRRAEEGDFGQEYDVGTDRWPDHVTSVGRAYNSMRVQLATIVLTDPLSGCLNRRGFDDQLLREVARAARAGDELSLLALDVDHFKLVNDTFGHLVGDQAIREIGQLLRETARAGDVVARVGGEEFAILAPATNAAGAANLAQRVASAFRAHRFSGVPERLTITVSVGVVTEPSVSEGIAEDLRARADEALYAAKRGGRNRVVEWTHGMRVLGAGQSADAPVADAPPAEVRDPASLRRTGETPAVRRGERPLPPTTGFMLASAAGRRSEGGTERGAPPGM